MLTEGPIIISINCLTTSLLKWFGHENFIDFVSPSNPGERVSKDFQRYVFNTITEKIPDLTDKRNNITVHFIQKLFEKAYPTKCVIICLQEVDNSLYRKLHDELVTPQKAFMTNFEVYQANRKPANASCPELDYGGCVTIFRGTRSSSLRILFEEGKLVERSPFQTSIFEHTHSDGTVHRFTVNNCHRGWKCYQPFDELLKLNTIAVGDLNLTEYYKNRHDFTESSEQKMSFEIIEKKTNGTTHTVISSAICPSDDVIMSNYENVRVSKNSQVAVFGSEILRLGGKVSLDTYKSALGNPNFLVTDPETVKMPQFMTDHDITVGQLSFT